MKVPTSLPFHLSEIYIDELEKVSSDLVQSDSEKPSTSPHPIPLSTLLDPFLQLSIRTVSNPTYKHIEDNLFVPLLSALSEWSPPSPRNDDSSDEDDEPRSKRQRLSECDYPNLVSIAAFNTDDAEPIQPKVLSTRLARSIFQTAGREETRDSNRRKLYKMCRRWLDDEGSEE
jgi:ribosomal RNA-processing protein 1